MRPAINIINTNGSINKTCKINWRKSWKEKRKSGFRSFLKYVEKVNKTMYMEEKNINKWTRSIGRALLERCCTQGKPIRMKDQKEGTTRLKLLQIWQTAPSLLLFTLSNLIYQVNNYSKLYKLIICFTDLRKRHGLSYICRQVANKSCSWNECLHE